MVAILLSAAGVARRRLNVAVGIRADPYVGPGRRDRQCVESFPDVRVPDARAGRAVVSPPRPRAAPTDAGHAIRDVVEPGAGRRLAMLVGPRRGHRALHVTARRCYLFVKARRSNISRAPYVGPLSLKLMASFHV